MTDLCENCNCLTPICDCCRREVDHVRGSPWHEAVRICEDCFYQWYTPDLISIGNYVRRQHGLPAFGDDA